MRHFTSLAIVALIATTYAQQGRACGGLFCSQYSPTPVDQSAERILFEVMDDGSVSATVEIKYKGDPSAFSWIVPVTGTPEFVEAGTKEELNLLDTATRPSFLPPNVNCAGGGFGCADSIALRAPNGASEGEGEGVGVTRYPSVGPYDQIVVVDGLDPQTLIDWLNDHQYRVTEAMRPFIEQYSLEGYSFLATKLQPNADVHDMAPIRFHCPQPNPEIPLRLTAIAAEPEMGFLVFVAANRRYTPFNYAEVKIDKDDLRVGPEGPLNYYPLVSKRIDEEGGLGFVVERAQPASAIQDAVDAVYLPQDGSNESIDDETAARDYIGTVLSRRQYVTRFYGRMSADEMIEDPEFVPHDGAHDDVDGTWDLSQRTLDTCNDPEAGQAPVCGTTYCGDGDACASDGNTDGCVCRGTHVARMTTGPSGAQIVMCTSPDIDLHGSGANVCASAECGNGKCRAVNDRPTCACDPGNVAVLDGDQVRCVPIHGRVHEPKDIVWDEQLDGENSGCTAPRGDKAGGALTLALMLVAGAVPGAWRRLRDRDRKAR